MADRTSYPDPGAASTQNGPFYPEPGMSPPAEVQDINQTDQDQEDRRLHEQLSRHINPELHMQHESHHDENLMQIDGSGADVQAMAQEVMNLNPQDDQQHIVHYSPNHSQTPVHESPATPGAVTVAGKPRSKVSRACDECRRKKIRCDSTNDAHTCTACGKSGVYCKFSRTPQKRGPSRGYIRELAERVTSLEGQLRHDAVIGNGPGLTTEDQLSFLGLRAEPTPTPVVGSKRQRSVTDNEDHFDHDRNGSVPQMESTEQVAKLDDQLINAYYNSIHPVLPIFHTDPNAFREYLTTIPNATRTALVMATSATLKAAPYSGLLDVNMSDNSYEILHLSQQAERPSLARVQSFIMLALGAGNHGNELFRDGTIMGIDPGTYIDQAISIAQRLHIFDTATLLTIESDQQFAVPRALALNLGILDTLNTFATKDFTTPISSLSTQAVRRDIQVFGHRIYWLKKFFAELCDLQSIEIYSENPEHEISSDLKYAKTRYPATNITELSKLRTGFIKVLTSYGDVSNMATDQIVALGFWYTRLIMELHFYPLLEPDRLLYPCRRIAELISQLPMTNPLVHHFAGLAAHILIQLADIRETRSSALEILEALDDALNTLAPLHVDSFSCDALVRDAVARKRSSLGSLADGTGSLGLEHLANAAVGSTDSAIDPADGGVAAAAEAAAKAAMGMGAPPIKEPKDWDPAGFSNEGYLLALSR